MDEVKFLTDENGNRLAVQMDIDKWEDMMKEVGKLRRDHKMHKAIEEIEEIERGFVKPVSLFDFIGSLEDEI